MDASCNKNLDQIGLFLSGMCAVHCLLTPFLIALVPILKFLDEEGHFHEYMAVFVLPVAIFAFWRGFRIHGNGLVFLLGFPGLFLLLFSLWVPEYQVFQGFSLAQTMTTAGGILLICGHLFNSQKLSKPL